MLLPLICAEKFKDFCQGIFVITGAAIVKA
jgi:hypothetical protein